MQHDPDEKFQQLPGYKIDRKRRLGRGAFGQVFVGSKIGYPEEYAIKIIQIKNAKNIDNIKKTQVQCLKNFNHQNIIKIIHHYYNQSYFYIVFEKCDYSLQTLIDAYNFNKKKLTDNQCFYILFQICQAFKQISSKNCIHRDLKPANILMKDGRVKIADFGLVTENQDKISKKQTTCGTSLYFPPELLENMEGKNQYSQKYDVWALGCIAYQLFIGPLPWVNIGAETKKMIFNGYRQMKGIENIPQMNIKSNPPSFQALKFMNSTLTLDSKKRKNWQGLLKILDQDKKQFLYGLQQTIKSQFSSLINQYIEEVKSKKKNSSSSNTSSTNQSNSQKIQEKGLTKQKYTSKKMKKIQDQNTKNSKNQSNELWLNNLLKQSSILSQEKAVLLLMSWIKNASRIELVFKASSNDFNMKKYYEQCGNLTHTIIIAKAQKGKIIGGYTPLRFNPFVIWTFKQDTQLIKDQSNSSFVFSLTQKQKFQLINKNKDAIRRYEYKSQIQFHDTFLIGDKSNKWRGNQFRLGKNQYNTSKYPQSKQSNLKITGQQNPWFLTAQWQVYQVFFQ